jgi:phosphatidylserine/phosphatidylglycerophosphate/cardiolipin synthase-like enzyme
LKSNYGDLSIHTGVGAHRVSAILRLLRLALVCAVVITPVWAEDDQLPLESPLFEMAADVERANQQSPDASRHQVLAIDGGFESFVLRVHLVRSATKTIDIQTFIWADEETSRYFANELVNAAKRGVKIRVLVDYMWSTKNPERLSWNLTHSENIHIKLYRPMARQLSPSFPRKIINLLTPNNTNQRMHNKVMVVDGAIGITGGRNIGNNYFDYSQKYNFKDRDIMVAGPSVDDMTASFEEFWAFKHSRSSEEFSDVARGIRNGTLLPQLNEDDFDLPYFQRLNELSSDAQFISDEFVDASMPASSVQFIADKPGRKTWSYWFSPRAGGAMSAAMRERFQQAEDSVLIQSPYVILNRRTRRMMRKVNKRSPGFEVKVSTNSFGAADHLETYSANYRLRTKVIRGLGYEIYEYKPNPDDLRIYLPHYEELKERAVKDGLKRPPYVSIHSKTFLFDDRIAYIGTYNLDPRSFYVNGECGFFVEDEAFVQDISQRLIRDMAPGNSWVIARKKSPLSEINVHIEGLSSLLPLDLWPVRYTSGFELIEGEEAVPTDHPDFYDRYRDLGSFPGAEGLNLDTTIIQIYKGVGKVATPLL